MDLLELIILIRKANCKKHFLLHSNLQHLGLKMSIKARQFSKRKVINIEFFNAFSTTIKLLLKKLKLNASGFSTAKKPAIEKP